MTPLELLNESQLENITNKKPFSLPRPITAGIDIRQKTSEKFIEQLQVDTQLVEKQEQKQQVLCHWCVYFVFDEFS